MSRYVLKMMSYGVAPNLCIRDRWSKKDTASIFMVVCRGFWGRRFLQNYLYLHNNHHNKHKTHLHTLKYSNTQNYGGHAVAQLVESLCYKLELRGFDSQCCHWNFSLT